MKRSYMLIFLLLCSFDYALGCGLCDSGPRSERPSFPRLTEAVMNNDQKQVEALLAQGEEVNGKDQFGLTPLMHAAALENQPLAKLLLDKGADIHALDENKGTCLFYAINTNNKEMVQLLIDNGAHIHAESLACSDKYPLTPIALAASSGDKELVQLLLDNEGMLKQKDLFFAAFAGCAVMIELMLDLVKDIDINAKDENGDTCLFHAVMRGDKDTVRLLIERGANRYDRSDDPYVDRILFDRNYDLLPLFLMSKEELAVFESEGRISNEVALILAIAENNKEKVALILDRGIDINKKDNEYGYTYLHYAALSGNQEMVQLLINRGADKEATCKKGLSYQTYLEYGPPPLPQINAENGYYTELEHQQRVLKGK